MPNDLEKLVPDEVPVRTDSHIGCGIFVLIIVLTTGIFAYTRLHRAIKMNWPLDRADALRIERGMTEMRLENEALRKLVDANAAQIQSIHEKLGNQSSTQEIDDDRRPVTDAENAAP